MKQGGPLTSKSKMRRRKKTTTPCFILLHVVVKYTVTLVIARRCFKGIKSHHLFVCSWAASFSLSGGKCFVYESQSHFTQFELFLIHLIPWSELNWTHSPINGIHLFINLWSFWIMLNDQQCLTFFYNGNQGQLCLYIFPTFQLVSRPESLGIGWPPKCKSKYINKQTNKPVHNRVPSWPPLRNSALPQKTSD